MTFMTNLQVISDLYMKRTLSERNGVVVLFVLVLITFSFAQEDTRKMEKGFTTARSISASPVLLAELKELPAVQVAQ
jgi:hypothetical protein